MERVLQPEGLYLCFSFGQPEDRLIFLDNDEVEDKGFLAWTVDVHGERQIASASARADVRMLAVPLAAPPRSSAAPPNIHARARVTQRFQNPT